MMEAVGECRPLREVLLAAIAAREDLTYRRLAELTRDLDPRGRGLSHAYLSQVGRGLERPAPNAIELVCAALNVPPNAVSEYVAAAVIDEFNYRKVDSDRLSENVHELLRALDALRADGGEPRSRFGARL